MVQLSTWWKLLIDLGENVVTPNDNVLFNSRLKNYHLIAGGLEVTGEKPVDMERSVYE